MLTTYEKEERKEGKQLYHYQKGAIQKYSNVLNLPLKIIIYYTNCQPEVVKP